MSLKIKHFVVFVTFVSFLSCKKKNFRLTDIKATQIQVVDSIIPTDTINAFISPYRNRINAVLDSTLAYAPYVITKTEGKYNTAAGNLMADAVYEQTAPLFNRRTGNTLDFVLLNHGGIRAKISKGKVSARTAYQIMPFENSIVVAELTGTTVRELVYYMVNSDMPHPISGIQIIIDDNKQLQSINIQGKPFDEQRNYFVATSNYLLQGGDSMNFFKKNIGTTETDYLIRNIMIDYFKKVDTIAPKIDDRYIKL